MAFFVVLKKVHWSDCDAAGIAWFPNYLGWFEDAEEEL
jgi:acyl-CoA thioesterase FadM